MNEPFAEFVKNNLQPPVLLITCGLPASYKSTASAEISKLLGYQILRSDLLRLEVLKNEDVFSAKVAGDMGKRLSVYDEMFRRADQIISGSSKGGLILDATFVTQDLRRRALEIAAKHSVPLAIMETQCPQERSLEIIRTRTKKNYTSNALTEDAYLANKAKFEAIDIDDLKKRCPNAAIIHFIVSACSDSPKDWRVTTVEKR